MAEVTCVSVSSCLSDREFQSVNQERMDIPSVFFP